MVISELTRHDRRSRRNTDRTIGITSGKTNSRIAQPIEMGGEDRRIARSPDGVESLLIRSDEKNIRLS